MLDRNTRKTENYIYDIYEQRKALKICAQWQKNENRVYNGK